MEARSGFHTSKRKLTSRGILTLTAFEMNNYIMQVTHLNSQYLEDIRQIHELSALGFCRRDQTTTLPRRLLWDLARLTAWMIIWCSRTLKWTYKSFHALPPADTQSPSSITFQLWLVVFDRPSRDLLFAPHSNGSFRRGTLKEQSQNEMWASGDAAILSEVIPARHSESVVVAALRRT